MKDHEVEREWLYEKLKKFVENVVEGVPSETAEAVLPQIALIMLDMIINP